MKLGGPTAAFACLALAACDRAPPPPRTMPTTEASVAAASVVPTASAMSESDAAPAPLASSAASSASSASALSLGTCRFLAPAVGLSYRGAPLLVLPEGAPPGASPRVFFNKAGTLTEARVPSAPKLAQDASKADASAPLTRIPPASD